MRLPVNMIGLEEILRRDCGRNGDSIPLWEPVVRIGHCAVAFVTEGGSLTLHSWVVYGIAITVGVCRLWIVIGACRTRLANLPAHPTGALRDRLGLISGGAPWDRGRLFWIHPSRQTGRRLDPSQGLRAVPGGGR